MVVTSKANHHHKNQLSHIYTVDEAISCTTPSTWEKLMKLHPAPQHPPHCKRVLQGDASIVSKNMNMRLDNLIYRYD